MNCNYKKNSAMSINFITLAFFYMRNSTMPNLILNNEFAVKVEKITLFLFFIEGGNVFHATLTTH